MRSASLKIPFPSFLCVSLCVFFFLFFRCLHTHVPYTNKTFTNKNVRNMSLLHPGNISNIFVMKLRTHTHIVSLFLNHSHLLLWPLHWFCIKLYYIVSSCEICHDQEVGAMRASAVNHSLEFCSFLSKSSNASNFSLRATSPRDPNSLEIPTLCLIYQFYLC